MEQQEKILQVLEQYIKGIHTQAAEDFLPIWAQGENVLISPAGCFTGTQAIYEDFYSAGSAKPIRALI